MNSVVVLVCLLAAGCGSTQVGASSLRLAADMDQTQYRIGDPVVVTVALENRDKRAVVVPRFDKSVLRFVYADRETGMQIESDPVSSKLVAPVPVELRSGWTSRRFLFTRMTGKEGQYALLVTFKASPDGAMIGPAAHAPPEVFSVTGPVSLRRDPANGMILKAQALELAEAQVRSQGANIIASRAVLQPADKTCDTGLYTWIVLLKAALPDATERDYAFEVDAYRGRARRALDLSPPDTGGAEEPAP